MSVSLFDLFSVGVGPSSSHTVGPMRAARRFTAEKLVGTADDGGTPLIERVDSVQVELFGSLSATGAGHGTFTAILLGLEGWAAEKVRPDQVDERIAAMEASGTVQLAAQLGHRRDITLRTADFIQRPLTHLERHSNAMTLRAVDGDDQLLAEETYYSVGGGFVVAETEDPGTDSAGDDVVLPYPFRTSAELMAHCRSTGLPVSQIMLANECARREDSPDPRSEVLEGIWHLWEVMEECKNSALRREGPLPGGLKVRRRAPDWHARLWQQDPERSHAY